MLDWNFDERLPVVKLLLLHRIPAAVAVGKTLRCRSVLDGC